VEELGCALAEGVRHLDPGDSAASASWLALDACHFDLNTCLRETLVLVKSFLVVLPEEQLDIFDFTIRGLCRARPVHHSGVPVIHARRIAAIAGK